MLFEISKRIEIGPGLMRVENLFVMSSGENMTDRQIKSTLAEDEIGSV
jgi:hypothetical protein